MTRGLIMSVMSVAESVAQSVTFAIGHAQFGSSPAHSIVIYRALLTGPPPAYQPESLAAIDSTDGSRYAHELWLVPRHAVRARASLGSLHFERTNEGIPVMSRFEAPHPTTDRSSADRVTSSR